MRLLSQRHSVAEMGRKRVFLLACKPGQESDFFKDCALQRSSYQSWNLPGGSRKGPNLMGHPDEGCVLQ